MKAFGQLLGALSMLGILGSAGYSASFQKGDVFASVNHNQIKVYSSGGALKQTLDTKLPPGEPSTTGSAFDKNGTLYVTTFIQGAISRFDNTGALQSPFVPLTSLTLTKPESILFDASGNAYVGDAGTSYIFKFDPNGNLLDKYLVKIGDKGTDWIDLAADQKTVFYTSEDGTIRRYDVSAKTQLTDFASPGGELFALRILPDKGVLVAHTADILRLDATGKTIQKYTVPGQNYWFALNLDPDGTSFWSADLQTGNIYKFDIASGKVLQNIPTGAAPYDLAGLSVYGELTASGGGGGTNTTLPKVDNAMTTKSVPQHCGDFVPTSVTNFLPTDAAAYLYFGITGGKAGDVASSQWIDPTGKTYSDGYVGGDWQPLPQDGNYCFNTDYLAIAGKLAANLTGTWTLKVTWNKAPLFTLQFNIGAPTPAGNLKVVINNADTSNCPTVTLTVTVTDDQGRPVGGLTSNNFVLKEDGQTRPITVTGGGTSTTAALSVGLVLDTSGSVIGYRSDLVSAAKGLVSQIPASVPMALYTFADRPTLVQDFTTDRAPINNGIDNIAANGGTAIYDAIALAVQGLRSRAGRKVIVLETDGDDNSSAITVDTAIMQAKDAGVTIFVVGVGSGTNQQVLQRIATETGGVFRTAQTSGDLASVLQAVGQTLTSGQYEITYTSGGGTADHNIELTATSGNLTGVTTKTVSACGGSATDGVVFTIENTTGTPGQAVDAPITMKAVGPRPASFQLDVSYDGNLLKFNNVRKGDQLANTGKDVSSTQSGNKVTVIGAGLNQNVIGDGTVALMNFTLSPNFPPNTKATLTCSNPISVDPQSKALKTTCVSGAITAMSTCSCDVNGDGATNVADVQLMINQVLGKVSGGCDLNGDGQLNVLDVQIVINAAMGLGCKR